MSYNLTIDDSSPVITYFPYADGSPTGGWSQWFNISGYNDESPTGDAAHTPLGTSFHVSQAPSASLSFNFTGVAVYIYGSTNCTYTYRLDSAAPVQGSPNADLLGSFEGLNNSQHTIELAVQSAGSNQQLAFDRIVATVSEDPSASSSNIRLTSFEAANSTWSYSGNWTTLNTGNIPSTSDPAPYRITKTPASSATLLFFGRGIVLEGPTNWGCWTYQVALDGVVSRYNASSWWLIGNTYLFTSPSGLDPTKRHNLTLTTTGSKGLANLFLSSATVFGLDSDIAANSTAIPGPTASPSHSHSGAIAGGVLGGVIGLALIAAIAIVFLRRRYRERDAKLQANPLDISEKGQPRPNSRYITTTVGEPVNIAAFPDSSVSGYDADGDSSRVLVIGPTDRERRTSNASVPGSLGPPQLPLVKGRPFVPPVSTTVAQASPAPIASADDDTASRPLPPPPGSRPRTQIESQATPADLLSPISPVPPDINEIVEAVISRFDLPMRAQYPENSDTEPPEYRD